MQNPALPFSEEEIDRRLAEFERIWPREAQTDLALLSIALLMEEAFGLRLRDEEILSDTISSLLPRGGSSVESWGDHSDLWHLRHRHASRRPCS